MLAMLQIRRKALQLLSDRLESEEGDAMDEATGDDSTPADMSW